MKDLQLPIVVLRDADHVRMIDLDQADLRNLADAAHQSETVVGIGLHAIRPVAKEILAQYGDVLQAGGQLVWTSARMVSGGR